MEVRAPKGLPKSEIDKFVCAKDPWIQKHLHLRAQRALQKADFAPTYGDKLLLQGAEYPIRAKAGNRIGFDGACFYLPPGLSPEEIRHALVQIYRMAAKKILLQKAVRFAGQMGVTPAAVKINGAKTRWGSCSGKNSINFSWRLAMAPPAVIDYVVVHELAHIREHNHSDRFWAVVAEVLPDYQARRQGLSALQERLHGENWE